MGRVQTRIYLYETAGTTWNAHVPSTTHKMNTKHVNIWDRNMCTQHKPSIWSNTQRTTAPALGPLSPLAFVPAPAGFGPGSIPCPVSKLWGQQLESKSRDSGPTWKEDTSVFLSSFFHRRVRLLYTALSMIFPHEVGSKVSSFSSFNENIS